MATLIHDTTVVSGDVTETVHHEAAILFEDLIKWLFGDDPLDPVAVPLRRVGESRRP